MIQVILAASTAERKPCVFLSWLRESVFLANLLNAFQGMGLLQPGATGDIDEDPVWRSQKLIKDNKSRS